MSDWLSERIFILHKLFNQEFKIIEKKSDKNNLKLSDLLLYIFKLDKFWEYNLELQDHTKSIRDAFELTFFIMNIRILNKL